MLILKIALVMIWIYLLSVFGRAKLHFFKFVLGSVCLFFFLMIFLQPLLLRPLSMAVTAAAGVLGDTFNMYDSYYKYFILFIPKDTTSVSLVIDYECSGIVEIMAFSSLLWFFPLYNTAEKLIINIAGVLGIFIANALRLFIICLLIFYFGNEIFYFAHTIFGRLIFYLFSIVLYFYVFTRSHVIRQKVGVFTYGNTNIAD
ncbi:MAG TPA: exosortase family protein XrtG [Bacillota bacterium]|nr:exosortase family protein XrtG [Bacillota bacterium]